MQADVQLPALCFPQPLARAAIQALKLFYVEQHDEGHLETSSRAPKRQKVSTVQPLQPAQQHTLSMEY
jgi:hypothetical protein